MNNSIETIDKQHEVFGGNSALILNKLVTLETLNGWIKYSIGSLLEKNFIQLVMIGEYE